MSLLSDIATEVKFRVWPGQETTSTYDSRLLTRFNWVLADLNVRLNIPDLDYEYSFSLAAGTRTYSLPSDILYIRSLKNITRERPLVPMSAMEESSVSETEVGEPTHFFHEGYTLITYPVASTTNDSDLMRLRARKKLTPFTSLSDDTALPTYCDELFFNGVSWRFHRDLNEPEFAAVAKRDYYSSINAINDFRKEEFANLGGTVRVVR